MHLGGAFGGDRPTSRSLGSCLGFEKSRTCNPLQPDSGWSECKYDFLHPQGLCQGVGFCVYVGGAQIEIHHLGAGMAR